jgi:predicted dithiol-disulfide oxidoreductase (DUF899 family)
MTQHQKIVSHDEWIDARKQFLLKEKEFNRLRDQTSQQRRELPWESVEKEYVFDGPDGKETLTRLFAGKSQLIVYHFMFGPDWEAGCPHCSFWADNFNGITVHLKHRDTTLVAVSQAPLAKLAAYERRMGWNFKWVSSFGTDFNFDYHVSFTPEELANKDAEYNFAREKQPRGSEVAGTSVFCKDSAGAVFHTYSTYARGIDMMNAAYNFLDLTPKGRDEAGHEGGPQFWVRRHDEYGD